MSHWTVTKTKTPFNNQWLSLKVDTLQTPQKTSQEYTYISRASAGVSIVPYFKDTQELLLVSQYRHPIGKEIWQFPGGTKEKGDSFKQTAAKELEEETGYKSGKLVDLGEFQPDAGIVSDVGRVFLSLENIKTNSSANSDPNEQTEPKKFKVNLVKDMIQKGEIRDGWTMASYLLFKMWLKNG